jgi:hypothetical protein
MSIRLQALPDLVARWNATVADAAAEGIVVEIADFGGYRTESDTALILKYKQQDYDAYAQAALAAGHTPLPITGPWDDGSARPIAPYGSSYHDFGAARDFTISHYPKELGMSYADAVRRVQELAESNGLRSGHDFGDDAHLELPVTLDVARQMWADYQASSGGIGSGTAVVVILALGVGIVALRYVAGLKTWS